MALTISNPQYSSQYSCNSFPIYGIFYHKLTRVVGVNDAELMYTPGVESLLSLYDLLIISSIIHILFFLFTFSGELLSYIWCFCTSFKTLRVYTSFLLVISVWLLVHTFNYKPVIFVHLDTVLLSYI